MTETDGKFAVLLSCSNIQCQRYGKQLPYYFNRTELSEMVTEANQDTIMCPSCGQSRKLTPAEKDSLRMLQRA